MEDYRTPIYNNPPLFNVSLGGHDSYLVSGSRTVAELKTRLAERGFPSARVSQTSLNWETPGVTVFTLGGMIDRHIEIHCATCDRCGGSSTRSPKQ